MNLARTDPVEVLVERLELPFNTWGVDPFGISKVHLATVLRLLAPLYRHYFDVKVYGIDHVPARGRAMLVGNHSGGIALDAAMVFTSLFLEKDPPRLVQAMAERFVSRVPFLSEWAQRTGQLTGLPEHAVRLLEDERLLLVFPEGARGTAKLYWERNSLVDFGTGFMRLALQTRSPIIPMAFLGGGSAIPTVVNLYRLGKYVGVPYLPITPWGLPLPRPAHLAIHYGAPMRFEGTGAEEDSVIEGYVEQVKRRISGLIEEGRAMRRRGA
ncbi:MAG: lysophospholipid acyltransferase family protein [Myxococcaceae bacterium]